MFLPLASSVQLGAGRRQAREPSGCLLKLIAFPLELQDLLPVHEAVEMVVAMVLSPRHLSQSCATRLEFSTMLRLS